MYNTPDGGTGRRCQSRLIVLCSYRRVCRALTTDNCEMANKVSPRCRGRSQYLFSSTAFSERCLSRAIAQSRCRDSWPVYGTCQSHHTHKHIGGGFLLREKARPNTALRQSPGLRSHGSMNEGRMGEYDHFCVYSRMR